MKMMLLLRLLLLLMVLPGTPLQLRWARSRLRGVRRRQCPRRRRRRWRRTGRSWRRRGTWHGASSRGLGWRPLAPGAAWCWAAWRCTWWCCAGGGITSRERGILNDKERVPSSTVACIRTESLSLGQKQVDGQEGRQLRGVVVRRCTYQNTQLAVFVGFCTCP